MTEQELDDIMNQFLMNHPGQATQEQVLRVLIQRSKLDYDQIQVIIALAECIAREISVDRDLKLLDKISRRS